MLAFAISSQVPWIVTFVMFLVGGGGLISWFRLKAENKKMIAAGHVLDAEADSTISNTVQGRYDKLFDDLQTEVSRLRIQENECRNTLELAMKRMAELRFMSVNAQAAVTSLQDRLDKLELDNESPLHHRRAVRGVATQFADTIQSIIKLLETQQMDIQPAANLGINELISELQNLADDLQTQTKDL